MFSELMPLLAGRTVMTTVARENDKTLRVNVIPTTKSGVSENPALTTPLSHTGTSEEPDTKLSRELAGYVECHRALGSTLAAAVLREKHGVDAPRGWYPVMKRLRNTNG